MKGPTMSAMNRFDPEIVALFEAAAATATAEPAMTAPERGDVRGLREMINNGLGVIPRPPATNVEVTSYTAETSDGSSLELRWYTCRDDDATGRPAVVYFHGGGRIAGKVEHYDGVVQHYVAETGTPMLQVEYRLAPEHPGSAAQEDGLAAITWLVDNARELRVDADRIGVMGDSGGGGVAAGTAILARDHDIHVAKQILIYPMLDDRNTRPDPHLEGLVTWTHETNWTGWHAVLGDTIGTEGVSPVAAPGRLTNFSGLPSAYIEVGDLDIFRDESMAFAQGLFAAGVPCELHINAGVIHGHDLMSFELGASLRSHAARCRAIKTL